MTPNARLTSLEVLSQSEPPPLTAREQQVCRWLQFLVDNPSTARTPEEWVSQAARILQGAGPYRLDVVLAAVFTAIWTEDQPGAYATRLFTVAANWLTTVRTSGTTQMLSALAAAAVDPRVPRLPAGGWSEPGKRRKKGKQAKQGGMDTDDVAAVANRLDMTDRSLESLGLKYQTDKASPGHNYLVHYEELLRPIRLEPIDILEIGVAAGSSIRMWHEYFPAATIVGVDVHPVTFDRSDMPRFTFVQGSQADPAFLHQLMHQFTFQLVVDDGSHFWAHQIFTFQTVFPLLPPGALYICEDIHTSFGEWAAHFQGGAPESAAAYFLRLAHCVAAAEQEPVRDTDDALLHAMVTKVQSITFLRHGVIIRG